MIRELKKQAGALVRKHYKPFLLPVFLYVLADGTATFLRQSLSESRGTGGVMLLWGAILFLRLVVLPLLLYRVVYLSARAMGKTKSMEFPFSLNDAAKLVVISFVPNVVTLLLHVVTNVPNRSVGTIGIVTAVRSALFIASLIAEYFFFACNYHYALHRGTVKETVVFSCLGMRGRFSSYLLLLLSFVLWDVLVAAFSVAVLFWLSGLPMICQCLLTSMGCGVSFYLMPYRYAAYTLFVKNHVKIDKKHT